MPADSNATEKEPAEQKVSILVVDDRPDKMLAYETILSDLKENIVCARSGKEALRCLLKQDFAVILLDVNMPIMDGFETAVMIRQRPRSETGPPSCARTWSGSSCPSRSTSSSPTPPFTGSRITTLCSPPFTGC